MLVHTRDANANAEESVKKTIGGRHRHGRKKKEKFPFYSCVSVCVCVYVVKRTSVCTRIYYISFLFPNNQCVRYSVKILQFFFTAAFLTFLKTVVLILILIIIIIIIL